MENVGVGIILLGLFIGSLGALRYDRGWMAAFLMTIAIAIVVHMTRDPPAVSAQHSAQHDQSPSG